MQYLLPCECGRKHPVSTSDAGCSRVCECGQKLVVPSLMALKRLEPAPKSTTKLAKSKTGDGDLSAARKWIACGIVVFLLGLVPTIVIQVEYQPYAKPITNQTEPELLFSWWTALNQGIDTPESPREMQQRQSQELWQMLFNGSVGLAIVGLGLCAVGGALRRHRVSDHRERISPTAR